MKFILFLVTALQTCFPSSRADLEFHEKDYHTPRSLTNKQLLKIANYYNETYLKEALDHIMIPRVVGTESHEKVKEYIVGQLKNLGWNVEEHMFKEKTPNLGVLKFTNIIARLNPKASRYLVLAAHYDSKYFPGQNFLGATDSAVPCAMLLHLAQQLHDHLAFAKTTDLSLMLVFFDGEEAFHQWSESDSLYGAKSLAAKWSNSVYSNDSPLTELDKVDLLVLLDLLGSKDPAFYSYFQNTARWHSLLVNLERRLRSTGVIPQQQSLQFLEKSTYSAIEDDHIPFLRRGTYVLHLIPSPFPRVWHTLADDYSAIDFPTIKSTSNIIQAFTVSYLLGETSK